jgi:hypothetical protein
MYKKPIEALGREIHYEPLPGEFRAVIIAAWSRGGLLPASAIDKLVPKRLKWALGGEHHLGGVNDVR